MKIALIYNFAQHYRTNIFTLMDKAMDIDFYFGDHYLNVKKMDYSLLQHKVTEVKNIELGPLKWQCNTIRLAWADYDTFIVLGEPMCLSTWFILLISRVLGKRIYFWTHGWYGREGWAKRLIKRIYFGMANGTMLYGEYARQLMIKQGFRAQKIAVIHNSLAYDTQIVLRNGLHDHHTFSNHFGNEYPTVVFVGRLTKEKKLHQLLQAQYICKENGHPFNVIFIGDGVMEKILKDFTQKQDLQNYVWFYGASYDEQELSQLLYDADLCVAPGNIGLTAIHAMSFGCPCISHNDFKWQMPEFEAIKENKSGTFFERDNVEDLARVIMQWFNMHRHDREQVRMACFKEIDENWNPHQQLEIIKNMIGI